MIQKNKGFTLIELSIVVIIISLIVAGIIGGQSLFRQAKLKSVTQDINKFHVAINNFKNQYGQLPGDIDNAYDYWGSTADCIDINVNTNTNGCNGDGNGFTQSRHEGVRSWQHLMLAGLINHPYTGIMTGGQYTLGINIPKGPFDNSGYENYNSAASQGEMTALASPSNGNGKLNGGVLSTEEAYAIDKKIDDGFPRQGYVSTNSLSLGCSDWIIPGSYLLTNTGSICRMQFKRSR